MNQLADLIMRELLELMTSGVESLVREDIESDRAGRQVIKITARYRSGDEVTVDLRHKAVAQGVAPGLVQQLATGIEPTETTAVREQGETKGDYVLPFAEVIDGTLMAFDEALTSWADMWENPPDWCKLRLRDATELPSWYPKKLRDALEVIDE